MSACAMCDCQTTKKAPKNTGRLPEEKKERKKKKDQKEKDQKEKDQEEKKQHIFFGSVRKP